MLYDFFENNFIQFPFQLLVSEIPFLIGIQRKNRYMVRMGIGVLTLFVLSYIWMEFLVHFTGDMDSFGESFIVFLPNFALYLGYAVVTGLAIKNCYEVNAQEVLFIVVGGYATQHMIFALNRIVLYLLQFSYQSNGCFIHLMVNRYLIFMLGASAVYLGIIRKNHKKKGFQEGDIRIAWLGLLLIAAAIGLSVLWSYPTVYDGTIIGGFICPSYSFLCCFLVLVMEYYVLRENTMKHEHEVMEQLLLIANAQQKTSKETIDIINIKCHDLKHQIRNLEKLEDSKERSAYIKEIQNAVSIYDATYHTGCKALDYVLREKTLLFNEREVQFSCMIDGETIDFMTSADVYALMGNILDNALERVLKEKEEERTISLSIRKKNEMVLMHCENRCSRMIEFEDGLPITDKKDRTHHGFGVKSIRFIVEKYGGDMFMKVENGQFCLDILLPIFA